LNEIQIILKSFVPVLFYNLILITQLSDCVSLWVKSFEHFRRKMNSAEVPQEGEGVSMNAAHTSVSVRLPCVERDRASNVH